jgi:gliding motility-associated-like protein
LYAQQPTDCVNAITVCGDSEINLDVNGIGTQELFGLNNCSSQENNSLWLKVTLVTDGTLGFTLTPESANINEDYDFFVFGPNQDCNSLGQAIRCSTTNPQGANQRDNLTGMNETETDTSEGPGGNGNSFVRWLDVTAGETYFIVIDRPIGNSPFNLEWTGTAEFASPPTNESGSSTATNIEVCDSVAPFDDDVTDFDLTLNTSIIIGSQSNVSISYFESESDANINDNEIIGNYNNTSNPQEVYAKITDNITGCFEIIPFELLVNSGPNFTQPTDLKICDSSDDGNDNNGQAIFDLSEATTEILVGQNASDYNITYHTSQTNAENGMGGLPLMYYNTDADSQTIFVRIETASNINCFNTTQLNLIVQPLPTGFNAQQLQCGETNISLFNLTSSNSTLTGGSANLITKFFNSLNDAENNNNEITNSTEYTNSSNPETIYVQVIDNDTSCFSIAELTLRISNTSANNSQIAVCDDDGAEDGMHVFDLTKAETDVLAGAPATATIAYYESLNNALLEIDALNTTYTNTSQFTQIIYARVENNNGCYGIAEIVLTVNELPDIETEDFKYYCLNSYPETITLDADFLDTNNYTFLWSTGENTPTIDVNEIGNYTVEVTSNNTTCSNIRTITVEPSNIATVESIEVIDASDNNTVTIQVSGEGEYEFALFNEYGSYTPFQSNNIFNNVLGGIYTVKIRDIKNGCGIVEANLIVIGFPKFFTPNGDGDNDLWHVKGLTTQFQPNAKIYIFNRYGKLMKELLPTSDGWDGIFNGNPLPTGGYWFSVKLQDGSTYKDHFTLKR